MPTAYIIHAPADTDFVEGYLRPSLGLPDGEIVSHRDFAPGQSIVTAIQNAISSSRFALVVVGANDEWRRYAASAAAAQAIAANRQDVIPVLISGDPPIEWVGIVSIDLRAEELRNGEIARLRERLGGREPGVPDVECPYPGLAPYASAELFFGREDEEATIADRLRHHGRLFVIGASGTGKSSLVRVAVNRQLTEPHWKKLEELRVGLNPATRLDNVLGGDARNQATRDALAANNARVLVVFDALEGMFSVPKIEREQFAARLQALKNDPRFAMVFSMRADFYPDLITSEFWPVDPSERIDLAPLLGDALRRAIREPARKRGVFIDDALVDLIVRDAADEPGALPLVQETLIRLWRSREQNWLSAGAYRALGPDDGTRLGVAITSHADATWLNLSDAARLLARRIFLRLIDFGQGRRDVRRQQPLAALRAPTDDRALFDQTRSALTDARLLTADGLGESTVMDISHEALLRTWPRLREWAIEKRDGELVRRRLEDKAREWMRLEKKGGFLDAAELPEAERFLANPDVSDLAIHSDVSELVTASTHAIESANTRRKRLERARNWLAIAAVVGLVVAWVFFIRERNSLADLQKKQMELVREQKKTVEKQTQLDEEQKKTNEAVAVAQSRQLARLAAQHVDTAPDTALLLAAEALQQAETFEARQLAMDLDNRLSNVEKVFPHGDRQTRSAISLDGQVAIASYGKLKVVAPNGGVQELYDASAIINVAFSDDGALLVALSGFGQLTRWKKVGDSFAKDARTTHEQGQQIAFDGSRLVSIGKQGVQVWLAGDKESTLLLSASQCAPLWLGTRAQHVLCGNFPNGSSRKGQLEIRDTRSGGTVSKLDNVMRPTVVAVSDELKLVATLNHLETELWPFGGAEVPSGLDLSDAFGLRFVQRTLLVQREHEITQYIYDGRTWNRRPSLPTFPASRLSTSSDGKSVLLDLEGRAVLLGLEAKRERVLDAREVVDLAYAAGSDELVLLTSTAIEIRTLATARQRSIPLDHHWTRVAVNREASLIAVIGHKDKPTDIEIYETKTGRKHSWRQSEALVAAAFRDDGVLFALSNKWMYEFAAPTDPPIASQLNGNASGLVATASVVVATSEGTWLKSSSDTTWKSIVTTTVERGAFALTPDASRFFACMYESTGHSLLWMWSIVDRKTVAPTRQCVPDSQLAVSGDGTRVAVTLDSHIRVFTTSGSVLGIIPASASRVAYARDYLVWLAPDGVHLLDVRPATWIQDARRKANRTLTEDERDEFFGDSLKPRNRTSRN